VTISQKCRFDGFDGFDGFDKETAIVTGERPDPHKHVQERSRGGW